MVHKQNHRVEQWKPNVSQTELRVILEKYVAKSQERAMNSIYNTIKLNCTNDLVELKNNPVNLTVK